VDVEMCLFQLDMDDVELLQLLRVQVHTFQGVLGTRRRDTAG
jgi:hypothetical protein